MNGTARDRSRAALYYRAQLLRFRSPRRAVREDLLEKATWNQHLKVGGMWLIYSLSADIFRGPIC